MSNHINRLKEITNPGSNINPDTAQEFISIMEDKYPNGEWKNAPVEVQASISAFEGHLNSFIYEPWAQDKLNQFHEFKNARGVLAGTLTPLATAPLVVATPIASNTYPRIDNPKFSSAIKKLQQALVDEDHAPNEVNPVNGIA